MDTLHQGIPRKILDWEASGKDQVYDRKTVSHYIDDGSLLCAGIKKMDIRHPASPRVVAVFDTPGEATCPVLAGEFFVVPDAFSLLVLKQH